MAHTPTADTETYTGHVKWFDPSKGFGFVTVDGVQGDILIHVNVLRNFGQSSVSEGAKVRISVVETQRGKQALEVFEIEAPEFDEDGAPLGHLPFDQDLEGGDLVPARVKWFDRGKGFGFANVFGASDDVFIHIEVLRRSALSDLQTGEAVAIRMADGDRGRLATQVSLWESALSSDQSSD